MLCYLALRACCGNWWKCFLGRRWLCRARAFWSRRDHSADVSCDRRWLARSRLFWRRRDLSSKVGFCWRILSPIRQLTSILISFPPRLPISFQKVSLYIRESYCIGSYPNGSRRPPPKHGYDEGQWQQKQKKTASRERKQDKDGDSNTSGVRRIEKRDDKRCAQNRKQ